MYFVTLHQLSPQFYDLWLSLSWNLTYLHIVFTFVKHSSLWLTPNTDGLAINPEALIFNFVSFSISLSKTSSSFSVLSSTSRQLAIRASLRLHPSPPWFMVYGIYVICKQFFVFISLWFCSLLQMPLISLSTQTQFTENSKCLTTTGWWRQWQRSCRILITRRDLTSGLSCCVTKLWLVGVTGRWSGRIE